MGKRLDPEFLEQLERPAMAAQVALAYVVMSDRPKTVDAIAFHGLSQGMYEAGDLFVHVITQWRERRAKIVAVMGGDGRATGGSTPGEAWIGSDAVVANLVRGGIEPRSIVVMDAITHSKDEARAIVNEAKRRSWQSVGSVSVAYHGGRMFPYMVAAMKEIGYWIRYHMLPSPTTDWWRLVLASQGKKTATCLGAIFDDAHKIEDHIRRGFAATFGEVFYYLRNRDEIARTQCWDYPGEQ